MMPVVSFGSCDPGVWEGFAIGRSLAPALIASAGGTIGPVRIQGFPSSKLHSIHTAHECLGGRPADDRVIRQQSGRGPFFRSTKPPINDPSFQHTGPKD
jgi:hypothetical protein